MEEVRKSYYAVIPASVRYDTKLPANAKLLYGELTALCNEQGFCWATNNYFAELYGVHKKTISLWISLLEKAGHIKTVVEKQQRKIYILEKTEVRENTEGYPQKDGGGIRKKVNHNNTMNSKSPTKEDTSEDSTSQEGESPISAPDGAGAPTLLAQYKKLEKNKRAIWDFIKEKKPDFIEPYFDLWNLFAAEKKLSKVQQISDARKRKFNVRVKEKGFDFVTVIKKAAVSEFILTARWFSWDWIMENDKNYLKVIEGNYDDKEKTVNGKASKKPPKIGGLLWKMINQYSEGDFKLEAITPMDFDLIKPFVPPAWEQHFAGSTPGESKVKAVAEFIKEQSAKLLEHQ